MIRVLVVDDHELFAQSLVRLLVDQEDIDVVATASSGEEGVRLASQTHPDVVIMDFAMPGMNGARAASIIVDGAPQTAVILLTGSENPGSYHASVTAGCAAWLTKTRAASDLVAVIRRVAAGEYLRVAELDGALPSLDELVVQYQPVVEMASRLVVGFEALVRWQHPLDGLVAPGRFLPTAEAIGYITDIDQRVFEIVVDDLTTWGDLVAVPPQWVSVNLSAVSLADPEALRAILEGVAASPVPVERLVIEVTETAMLHDIFDVEQNMRLIEDSGIKLALDDFGTAFSAISYLRRFRFDKVKIDRSFVSGLPDDERSDQLVRTIRQMADSLDADTVAEGVEDEAQRAALLDAGVHLAQGFLFSPSVSFDSATQLVGSSAPRL